MTTQIKRGPKALLAFISALALSMLTIVSGGVAHAAADWPGQVKPGYQVYGILNSEYPVWFGALENSKGDPNWYSWCTQAGYPWAKPEETISVNTISSVQSNGQPADLTVTTAQMAWILANKEKIATADSRAAIGYIVHLNFETGTSVVPGPTRVQRIMQVIQQQYPQVHTLAKKYVAEAKHSGVKGYESLAVAGEGTRTGNVHGIAAKNEKGQPIANVPVKVTLSGPAVFTSTGTNTWSGKTKAQPLTLEWKSTGNGEVTFTTKFWSPRKTLTKYSASGDKQDTISYGTPIGSGDPEWKNGPSKKFRVIFDFQPRLTSKVTKKVVDLGDEIGDTLSVSADPKYGDGTWVKIDGKPVPVKFEGTAYLVGNTPAGEAATAPKGAEVVGTASFTANGPGDYNVKLDKVADKSGMVNWVWKMSKASQPKDKQVYIHGDFADRFGLANETASVRYPVKIDSSASVRETKSGNYLVDDLFVTGMPQDHPNFKGGAGFKADAKEITQTLLFFPKDLEVTDENATKAETIGKITAPAKNGFYPSLGSTEFKVKDGVEGTYVFVTEFAGDDRVAPLKTSVTDVTEQYKIQEDLTVTTKATPEIQLGEEARDTAIVKGSVPEGAQLGFELFKSSDGKAKTCTPDNLVFTSEKKSITEAGEYESEGVKLEKAGTYYWVETVYDKSGATIHRGECGLPHETTKVGGKELKVTTKATPEITVGQKAHDTAIVEGYVPEGTKLGFELFKSSDGKAKTCTPDNLVFTSEKKSITKAGEYESEGVKLDKAGTYYWVETAYDKDGKVVHRGECGLPHETTVVKPRDTSKGGAGRSLAKTGTGPLAALGIAALLSGAMGVGGVAIRRKMTK